MGIGEDIATKIAKPCQKCIYYSMGKYLGCAHRGCDYQHSEFKERGESDELDTHSDMGSWDFGEYGSDRGRAD